MSFCVFNDKQQLLPAFSKPYSDEVLSSWLTRLSFDHGLSKARLLKTLLTRRETNNWNVDRSFNDRYLATIATVTNCTTKEIADTTLQYYAGKLYEGKSGEIIPGIWTHKRFITKGRLFDNGNNQFGLLYCPGCFNIADKPIYFKKQWRLAVSFVCPDCECYLRETCPHCGSGGTTRCEPVAKAIDKTIDEYLLTCHECGGNISEAKAEPAPANLVQMQKAIYEIMKNGKGEISSVSYFSVLYQMVYLLISKAKGNKLLGFIKDVYDRHRVPELNRQEHRQEIHEIQIKQRANLFYMAYWLLENWPHRFTNLCNKHSLRNLDVLAYFRGCPGWFLETMLENVETTSRNLAPDHFEIEEIDRYTVRMKDERLNKFLYDFDPDDNFYYYDKNINSMDHGNQSCNSRAIYKQLQEIDSWYY